MSYEDYTDQQRRQYAKSVPIDDWRKQFKGKASNQKLLNMVPKPNSTQDTALDIGAGEGYHTKDLMDMGYEAVGIELLEKRVADAHKLGKTYVQQGDAHNLPWPSSYFSVVFMHEVLEHCMYPDKVLKEIYRVLKPRGTVVISLPLEGHWKPPQAGKNHNFNIQDTHVWKPTALMLHNELKKARFENFTIELCVLGGVAHKMNYKKGDKVSGFKPHAYVKSEK